MKLIFPITTYYTELIYFTIDVKVSPSSLCKIWYVFMKSSSN
jgi:hypothetical protein